MTLGLPAAGPRGTGGRGALWLKGRELFGASEAGWEGVACVGRMPPCLCPLCSSGRSPAMWRFGPGRKDLLDFVLWMHDGDGRWHNFIYDWHGTRNTDGPTSAAGMNFWQARAICALAEATLLLDNGSGQKLFLPKALSRLQRARRRQTYELSMP